VLILPGGTMNMLAKLLHGSIDPAAIVTAASLLGFYLWLVDRREDEPAREPDKE